MAGFAKLDSGIVDSTIWQEPHDVLRVWIAMLAKCDSVGIVRASVPAMARLCFVTVDRFLEIVEILAGPDKFSRTPDDEGRRVKTLTDGGWMIVNYIRYRELEQGKDGSHAERQRRYRERLKKRDSVTGGVTRDAEGEGERRGKKKRKAPSSPKGSDSSSPPGNDPPPLKLEPEEPPPRKKPTKAERLRQITSDAIEAFNAILAKPIGLLRAVKPGVGRKTREKQVRRCVEIASEVCRDIYGSHVIRKDFWEAYFGQCHEDDFLSGRKGGGPGHENWLPSFEFLTRPDQMLKIYERATGDE